MSQAPGPTIDLSRLAVKDQSTPLSNAKHEVEKPRHVFPRSSRRAILSNRGNSSRISKSDRYRNTLHHMHQLSPRVTFHKVIGSFFGTAPGQEAQNTSPQTRSRASSFGSRPSSSIYGSVPSLDFISSGAFLFSGPDLPSAGSYTNSTPKLHTLAGSFEDGQVSRRFRSESFSMVDDASAKDEFFDPIEPISTQGVVRSTSEMLHGVDTPIEEIEDSLFECPNGETAQVRPTPFRDHERSSKISRHSSSAHGLFQNSVITACVLRYTDSAACKSIRLTCRKWRSAVTSSGSPVRPASRRLPTEILICIFELLNPKDFNSARRICRDWMAASIDKRLLNTMLLRGGWKSESQWEELNRKCLVANGSEVWELSRALSRECALDSNWTGNGLDTGPATFEATEIDFSELAGGYTSHLAQANSDLIFTSSVCGKFLLVAKDTCIYVYSMSNGLVQPLTSVACPRRVLAMSMNASVGRDAIGALLEGRMGMVCELRYGRPSPQTTAESGDTCVEGDGHPPRTKYFPGVHTGTTDDLQDALDSAEHTSPRVLHSFPYVQDPIADSFDTIELKSHNQEFSIRDADNENAHDRNLINNTWNLHLRGPPNNRRDDSEETSSMQTIPVESSTSTFYRHLCSDDDPPRNVSICPQRRCVAFGCSAGIELYWIDALTGQSLSRWFPLTSPSDYLYFLSPRHGFESAKKLRLITSAAHPNDRQAISQRAFAGSTTMSSWCSFGFEARSRQFRDCNHYHAIPLSDGHHVLFVNPTDDQLTLGCDTTLGGPAKLLRKVVLIAPEENVVPRIYTAAFDLSSGARIVAMFGNTVVLYSIPADVLALSRSEQAAESWDVHKAPPFSLEGRHPDHWLNWWDGPAICDSTHESETDNSSPVWPISLAGTEIARLPDVCELAVQTRPEMVIWAFTSTSQCKTWRLRKYVKPVVKTRQVIGRAGLVREVFDVDEAGNMTMHDDLFSSGISKEVADVREGKHKEPTRKVSEVMGMGMDGHTSGVLKIIPRALATENDMWVDNLDVFSCADAWYDGDGDLVTWYKD